jgi:hypothetical protein
MRLLLGQNLAGVELDQHGSIRLHLLQRDGKPEIVEDQKLKFQVIELRYWQAANLQTSAEQKK